MIKDIIKKTVGENANFLFNIRKKQLRDYTGYNYEKLMFCNDLELFFQQNKEVKYDFIIIDADNQYKKVKKSLNLALKKLNKNGIVVLVNSLPPNRKRFVSECERPGMWLGQVWKVVSELNYRPNVDFVTYQLHTGYTFIINGDNSILHDQKNANKMSLKEYCDNYNKYARLVNLSELSLWYKEHITEVAKEA